MSNPTTPFYPMTHDDAQELIAAIGDNSKIAAAYDSTRTYELNDHCIYSGSLYRCVSAITVAEQWTPAHWESITVGEELTETSKGLAKLIPVISGAVNNSGYTIASGDYFEADGNLYKATAAIPIGYAWASSGSAVSGTAINSLNSKIVTQSFSASLTLEANASGSTSVDVSKPGYTPVGIISVLISGTTVFTLGASYIAQNNAVIYAYNTFNASRTGTITFTILYIAT